MAQIGDLDIDNLSAATSRLIPCGFAELAGAIVQIHGDGPVDNPVSGNYTYGTTSGPGTPAIVIPDGFWGIEGISRAGNAGATNAVGTFISFCQGLRNPVSGCTGNALGKS